MANVQLTNLNQKVEELASKTFSKEESKDLLLDENLKLREEVYKTASKLERVSIKLEKLMHNNDLLRSIIKRISQNTSSKRHSKFKVKTMFTPRSLLDTTPENYKSVGNLRKSNTIASNKKQVIKKNKALISKSAV